MATGALFLALFGVVWAVSGASAIGGAAGTGIFLLALGAAAALCLTSVRTRSRSAALPHDDSPVADAARRQASRRFGLVVALQWLSILAAIVVLGRLDRGSAIPAVVALIVGVHFFPLAGIFRVPAYRAAGAALCLLALVALWAPPASRLPIVGFGSAAVLFLTAAVVLVRAREAIRIIPLGD